MAEYVNTTKAALTAIAVVGANDNGEGGEPISKVFEPGQKVKCESDWMRAAKKNKVFEAWLDEKKIIAAPKGTADNAQQDDAEAKAKAKAAG